ncbi:GNAT family N-acetyltransferase [Jongsikchunia kroppenstedtii]|uniref:GNAT family N-acetyltransferase n=1 Tax=Jongsikchunia kroppenstedtii TaxID=1121721 RepID=UPI000477996B|nr:GNAT family N-acetyltransferase [Jongsikchunia kroppenstedtii]
MTEHDKAATRRDITHALETALERRHEVLDLIVDAEDQAAAEKAIADLLGVPEIGAKAVLGMAFRQLTKSERRKNAKELEDLNSQLTFTLTERPAASGDGLSLRAFNGDLDAELFKLRTDELGAAGDGSGSPAGSIEQEIAAARQRVDAEEAVWLIAAEGGDDVGIVFGELSDGEVDVRIWIAPDHRKKGYGTAALRKSRSEMAAYFPGVPMVVRAPSS